MTKKRKSQDKISKIEEEKKKRKLYGKMDVFLR